MSMPEQKFKEHLERLEENNVANKAELTVEIQNVAELVRQLEKTMNGRLKDLEIKDAKREGREERDNGGKTVNWTKIIVMAFSIALAALAVATQLAKNASQGG